MKSPPRMTARTGFRRFALARLLPSVLMLAAAAGPLAHLLRVSEAQPQAQASVHIQKAQPQYCLELAGNWDLHGADARNSSTHENTAGATDQKDNHPQTRLLKPVTDHWDTASGVEFGQADVPHRSATAGSIQPQPAPRSVRAPDRYFSAAPGPHSARGPPQTL